jgi:hypothetical protein
MTVTCAWCNEPGERNLGLWIQDGEGLWWHQDCRRSRLDILNEQMIKERHDGPKLTRDSDP